MLSPLYICSNFNFNNSNYIKGLHKHIQRWQNLVKTKIARVANEILRVVAVIARFAAKSGI